MIPHLKKHWGESLPEFDYDYDYDYDFFWGGSAADLSTHQWQGERVSSEAAMARRLAAARAAGKVSVAVFISRILGLVREQVLAAVFGASFLMDAWLVAFRIPSMLRDLFAEGALSSAFVPTFTAALRNEGAQRSWQLANLVFSTILVLLGLAGVLLLVFSDLFVYLLAGGFGDIPGKVELTSTLLKILSPFILLVASASVAMGILNAHDRFFLPALAPAFFNVCLILAGLFLAPWFESWGTLGIYALSVGALAGGMAQLAVQLPALFRLGFRFRFGLNLRDPGIRRIGRLLAPAVIGVSAVQITVLINTQIAAFLGDGPISWLSYAFRIIYLPIGLFGVAVGTVNLREVSVYAASEQWEELKTTVANSLKLIAVLAMPSTLGLWALAEPITRALYQRGQFTAQDSANTAQALIFYGIGLFAYSCVKVYAPTFYALDDTRTPVRISLAAVVVNLAVNVLFVFVLLPEEIAFAGLALGTSIGVLFNSLMLARSLRARLGPLRQHGVGEVIAKTLAAAAVMGVLVHFGHATLEAWIGAAGEIQRLTSLGLSIAGAAIIYFGLCWLLKVEEVRLLARRLFR